MTFSVHFRAGVKTAIPVWFAFIPIAFAMGVGARVHGLHWGEIVLMSALVYGAPRSLRRSTRWVPVLPWIL